MSNNNSNNDPADLGCVIIIGLVVLPFVLSAIIQALIPYFVIGGIGFVGYRLYVYDARTGNITAHLEDTFRVRDKENKQNLLEETEEIKALPSASAEELALLRKKLEDLEQENKAIREERKQEISIALEKHLSQIEQQKESQLLKNVFDEESPYPVPYSSSDAFEEREKDQKLSEREKEIRLREHQQEIDKKLLDQDRNILEVRYETRQEIMSVRQDMAQGFLQVEKNLQLLAQEVITFKSYVEQKFTTLETSFKQELATLGQMITSIHYELKQDISDTKHQFGKEILRIDKQQMTIIDKMRTYENKVREYGNQLIRIKMDSEKFAMRGQQMLKEAELTQQRHRVEIQGLSKDISTSLEKMALKEQNFALSVGTAKLKMDEISNQQYLALKDMAYERIGINALREDYSNRVTIEQQKLDTLNLKQQNLLNEIQRERAHNRDVSRLEHQLQMTKENLNHSQNNLNLFRQEMATVNRLSKN